MGLGGLMAVQVYLVRELLAAMLMFTVVFAAFAMLAGLVYFTRLVGLRLAAWSESFFAKPTVARRSRDLAVARSAQ
jgi:hypothetical protein